MNEAKEMMWLSVQTPFVNQVTPDVRSVRYENESLEQTEARIVSDAKPVNTLVSQLYLFYLDFIQNKKHCID